MRKESLLGVWVVIGLFLATAQASIARPSEVTLTYAPHDQIIIYNDDNFTAENGVVGGNGTADNPYMIEGWDIDISGIVPDSNNPISGIQIGNTHAFFTVKNVRVHGNYEPVNTTGSFSISGNPAIVMYFGGNARIENCILANTTVGIMMTGVDRVVIRGNTIIGNSRGIEIDHSSHIYIEDNYVANNQLENIDLSMISDSLVKNNTILNSSLQIGMNLYDSERCDVLNNTISDNGNIGLNIGFCRNCRVAGNTVTDSRVGITIYGEENVLLEENAFSNNNKNIDDASEGNSISGPAITIAAGVAAVAIFIAAYLLMRKVESKGNPP